DGAGAVARAARAPRGRGQAAHGRALGPTVLGWARRPRADPPAGPRLRRLAGPRARRGRGGPGAHRRLCPPLRGADVDPGVSRPRSGSAMTLGARFGPLGT